MSDHTAVLPEHPPVPAPRRSRGLLAVVASVVVVVLVAGGGFAAWRWFSGTGPRPADVLPASTFALVSVDLDPSGGQKVEAIKTLRKFPAFRDKIGLTPDSDPLERIFEEMQKDGICKGLDYDRDVKSWIGQRLGLGGVLLDGKPRPVMVLQVSDAENAKSGFTRLATCAEFKHYGWTLVDHYIVVSDTTAHAEEVAAEGKKSPLSENDDYQKWTDEAGGAGIMNAYVGRQAVDVLSEQLDSGLKDLPDLGGTGSSGSQDDKQLSDALASYKDFRGAGAVLRFADGGIELSAAGGGGKATRTSSTVTDHVAAMPADTALLLALAVPPQAFKMVQDADPNGSAAQFLGSMIGIDFPQDLQALLGRSVSISLGGDAPEDLNAIDQPSDLSLGALIEGDPARIDTVIGKLQKGLGTTLEDLQVVKKSDDGKVALASNEKYADQLLGKGSLADDEGFKDAVPHAEDSQMIAYADFDGDWGKAILKTIRDQGSNDDQEIADNLAALRALGVSAWRDGDVSHGLVRLTLK